jgi:hypothetical protein
MYGFPTNLDLSSAVGKFATQLCIGHFDLQFALGEVRFVVYSPIELLRGGIRVGYWDAASWPDPAFYDLMNTPSTSVEIVDSKTLVLRFANGLEARLTDDSNQYETMQILVGQSPGALHVV